MCDVGYAGARDFRSGDYTQGNCTDCMTFRNHPGATTTRRHFPGTVDITSGTVFAVPAKPLIRIVCFINNLTYLQRKITRVDSPPYCADTSRLDSENCTAKIVRYAYASGILLLVAMQKNIKSAVAWKVVNYRIVSNHRIDCITHRRRRLASAKTYFADPIAFFALWLFIAVPAHADTFPATADSYTGSNAATSNFGSESVVRVQNWASITGFAKFDLSTSSGSPVDLAILEISANDVKKSGVIEVYAVLGNWTEAGITHATRPSLAAVPVAAFLVSGSDTGQTIPVDITPLVNQWLANPSTNFGLALVPTDVNLWANSRESGQGMRIVTTALVATPKPANRFPQNGELNISSNPTLDLSCTSALLVDAQYQVSTQSNFSTVVYDSGAIADDICSHRAEANLNDLTAYFWRGRQRLENGTWSAWSTPTGFTVADMTGIAENLFQDGQLAYTGTRDADIRGSGSNPQNVIRNWNQGAQDVIRTGRRPSGSSTDEIYRLLLEFDLSALASSSAVINAWIELTGWRHDDAAHNQEVSIVNSAYRLLKPWGEGNGIVEAPLTGETSWLYTENPVLWSSPGASLASDTAANADRRATPVITSRPRNLEGLKSVWTSREFLNLVRFWIDNPGDNDGLLFKANDESLRFIMNFASREHADPSFRPKLIIESSEMASVPANTAPQVNAGADFAAATNTLVALNGAATDDGLPSPPGNLAIMWSKLNGPGIVTFTNNANPLSQASFAVAGSYTLQLRADDGALQASDQVIVTVTQSSGQSLDTQADSYTRSNTASVNYGADTVLRVQNWGNMTGFIRFDLSSFAPGSSVSAATLRIGVFDVKLAGTVNIHKVLGNWSEFALTENNKPALGPIAASFFTSASDEGQNIEIDVTALFNQLLASPVNNFGIALAPADVNAWFDSREGGTPAEIIVESGGPPTNTAPQVNAGNDRTVTLAAGANLLGNVNDDGLPNPPGATTLAWTKVSGPGTVTFGSPNSLASTASFSQAGSYVLRLTANDSALSGNDTLTVTVTTAPTQMTFSAVQDSYTKSSTATTNYGTDTVVRSQTWSNITGFARFNLSSLAGSTVSSATLRMTVDDVKKNGNVTVHKVLGSWGELTLTENNKPALGPPLATLPVSTSMTDGQIIQVNITGLVNALLASPASDFGLALVPGDVNLWIDSRESGAPATIDIIP
jgi:hypothetical protein